MRLGLAAAKPTDAVTYGLLPAAARLGLEVFLLTDQPDGHTGAVVRARPDLGRAGQGAVDRGPAGRGVQPRIVGCDVYDTGALVGRIAGLPRMDAVFSNSDHLQAQTALAADYFGLPGKDWRSCLRAKNKAVMRRRLAETGAEKVTAAEIAPGDEPPAGLPYPVVLKPAEGVASEDVTLVGSPGELAERCAEFFGRRPGEKLVAEEYLPGTLRTLETLGDGETTWVLGGFLTTVSAPPWFVEERLTWDPLPPGEELDHVRRALGDLGRGLAGLARPGETLRIEPGRAVTAYCGWYLTRVLDVKHSHGEAFAVVAGGTHHLRTPAAKGHDQPFAVIAVEDWAPPWPRPGVRDEAVTIAGQLCTPKDVLARRVRVGRLRALRVGDLVAFGLAGAYAWNISHHGFLMHPPPSFHYLA